MNKLYKLLEASNPTLAIAGCQAIGVMGRFSPLPIPDSLSLSSTSSPSEAVAQPVSKKQVLDKLIVLLQHTERKVKLSLYYLYFYFYFLFPNNNYF